MGITDYGTSLEGAKITDLDFSVDVVIFTKTSEVLVHILDIESEPSGLKFSWINTKIPEFFPYLVGALISQHL